MKMWQKVNYFIEKQLMKFSLLAYVGFFIIVKMWNSKFYINVIIDGVGRYITTENNSIITVATVFVGVYFTIYTIFTAISTESILVMLEEDNFKSLVKILKLGFYSSMVYIIFSMVSDLAYKCNKEVTTFAVLLILIVFGCSTIILSLALVRIFDYDINKVIKQMREEKARKITEESTDNLLREFLEDYKNIKELEEAKEMSNKLQSKRGE
ncbi:hypothetical protein NHG34_05290 [Aerococcaceae bacterium NML190938]|nr:hypothetical protein [Aerococcaceae bacterium NML190938]